MNKIYLFTISALILISSLALYNYVQLDRIDERFFRPGESPDEIIITGPNCSEPVGLDSIVNATSFNDAVQSMKAKGTTVVLPKWLPNGLAPTKAYVGPVAVFVYSYKGIERIASAEFTIQITYGGMPFTSQPGDTGIFTKVGQYDAYYNDKAYVGWSEYIELYGPTSKLLVLHVGYINYWFKAIPAMSKDDLFKIAESIF